MSIVIYWFRNDLRLNDNPALAHALKHATHLLPVYCHDVRMDDTTAWNFPRVGRHRRHFVGTTLDALGKRFATEYQSALFECYGRPYEVLARLATAVGADRIVAEAIEAPEEQSEVELLRAAGITVELIWQSSLIDPRRLPFDESAAPDVFTDFRKIVERQGITSREPIAAPDTLPRLPNVPDDASYMGRPANMRVAAVDDSRSSFPYAETTFFGGEDAALHHLEEYCAERLPHSYKATRNGLSGTKYSSKFSPWLALGSISAPTIYAAIRRFEATYGANDGSYWLWFELLWRDYFRVIHRKYGKRLFRGGGLTNLRPPHHDVAAFDRWRAGRTGEAFIDAGMRDLAATGYLSNRLRQNVASYLVHDLACDWRAGAAWFESMLLDYDVYSNQGNWLYVSGRGTDPRVGRRFNPQKQAHDYDADAAYRKLWDSSLPTSISSDFDLNRMTMPEPALFFNPSIDVGRFKSEAS